MQSPTEIAIRTSEYLKRTGAALLVGAVAVTGVASMRGTTEASAAGLSSAKMEKSESLNPNTSKGYWEVGGKPFFPRFSWSADLSVLDAQLPYVNTFAGISEPDNAAFANALGDKGYVMGTFDNPINLPSSIGNMEDEPDGYHKKPEDLVKPRNGVSAINFMEGFITGQNTQMYKDFIAKAESVGVDYYIANRYDAYNESRDEFSNPYTYPGLTFDLQRTLISLAGNNKPSFQWIETGVIDSKSVIKEMKREWVSNEVGLALAGGAKGIGWWTNTWPDGVQKKFDVSNEVKAVMLNLSNQMESNTSLFTSPIIEVGDIKWNNPVKVGVRSKNGRYYAIVVNASKEPQKVKQLLPGLSGQQVVEYINNDPSKVSGAIVDSGDDGKPIQVSPLKDAGKYVPLSTSGNNIIGVLNPYQWVIYSYDPSKKVASTDSSKRLVTLKSGKAVLPNVSAIGKTRTEAVVSRHKNIPPKR